jgi:hypothetical protein
MSPTEPITTTTTTETYRHRFLGTLALLVALAAAGLLAVVLYARPAEANYPGKPGKIAYSGYDGNDDEVYTIKPDGGGKLPVTDDGADSYDPVYSPTANG